MLMENPHIPRNEAVRVFLRGLFDYAGLFPPASLTLEKALSKYARFRVSSDKWMIGPFVCHVSALDDLEAFGHLFEKSPPFLFSILTRTAENSNDFLPMLLEDLDGMNQFVERHSGNVAADMIEVRVPPDASADKQEAESLVSGILALDSKCLFPEMTYLEVARNEDFAAHLENVASAIGSPDETKVDSTGRSSLPSIPVIGMKLRCGGMDALDYPTTGQIATFLKTMTRHRVRFKVTAGLHHPVRHLDTKSGFMTHGFLNVFFAAALDAVHDMSEFKLIQVLEEQDADAFRFSDDEIRWRDLAVSTIALAQIRERFATSIGSCSFDEPRVDLVSLEWLSVESLITSDDHSL